MKNTHEPLRSIRVLEVSHAIAGPTAGQVLADYGAEVIKIERPGLGDIFRDVPGMGQSMFLAINRGKKSLALDLKKIEGLSIFYHLVKKSDVVIENLGPGVAEAIGISYSRVKKANNEAIYCKIESFGRGPYEITPAYDPVLQAAVGIMSTTGFPPDRYARAGVSIVDMSTGLQASSGILALLLSRQKTGRGGELRVSLYDSASYFMSYWIARYDISGQDTSPLGSGHIFGSPYNLFRTSDGHVYLAIASDSHWRSFCGKMGFGDLLVDSYEKAKDRVRLKETLEAKVSTLFADFSTKEVERRLRGAGIPFGVFNTVKSLLEDPHFLGREILKDYTYKGSGYRTTVNPVLISGERPFAAENPPQVGQDSEKILRSILKLGKKKIASLQERGVIS